MEIINNVKLGEVDFFGQHAIVFREIHANGVWKLVLMIENRRIVMMSY